MADKLKQLKTTVIGNIGELTIGRRLLEMGYEVYFGMSQNSCDMIALDPETHKCYRVEVKTLSSQVFTRAPHSRPERYDILALIRNRDYAIKFKPNLPWLTNRRRVEFELEIYNTR